MEEKIIEGQFTKNKLTQILFSISAALIGLAFVVGFVAYSQDGGRDFDSFSEFIGFLMLDPFYHDETQLPFILIVLGILNIFISLFFMWKMSRCTLTITNRRVTGKASFGKYVDLPLNQISSVGLGAFSRISVATSSGQIHFWFIKNRNEIHSKLTDIIGKVQVESAYTQSSPIAASDADELKKYKELLDSGVISQEEFDAKKKQLLGL